MAKQVDPIVEASDRAAEELAKRNKDDIRPSIDPSREAELDAHFQAHIEKQGNTPAAVINPENFGRENGGVKIQLEGTPKEEKPTEEIETVPPGDTGTNPPATPGIPPVTPPVAPAADDKPKGLLDGLLAKPAAEAAAPAAEKPAATEDPYGTVKLRSDASPKTRETFDELKRVAKEREAAARQEAEAAKQSLSELQNKVAELEKRTVPDEVQNELKELRAFRAQFDTQNDPEFRSKFDARVDQNYESVYSKLTAHGFPASELAKLKAFSQADRDAAIENLLPKLPSLDRKYIEAKLFDNVNISEQREKALLEARQNADKLLAERKQAPAVQTAQRDAAVAEVLRPVLPKIPWLHVKEIPPTTAPEEKKRLEADNAFALQMQEALKTAIVDDSPRIRAEAAIAVPLAQYYQREFAKANERAESLQKQLDQIRSAGALSRTARSVASPNAAPAHEKEVPTNAADALDQLFAQARSR